MLFGINEDLALPLMASRRKVKEGHLDLKAVKGKTVLVTGAGGSIGSELVRQIASSSPKELLLLDHSEENLYDITCTLAESDLTFPYHGFLADIRDYYALNTPHLMVRNIDLIIHAAALKHVPLLETPYNVMEALRTNVLGTYNLMRLAQSTEPKADFVMISTDKAVEPTSMMGMTKRLAELLVSSLAKDTSRHAIVRFGNVMGSSGSVIPLFRRQIAQGGPVTITDFEMTRYFMSIQQAVNLTLKASEKTCSDVSRVYVLRMGDPVKIVDLARTLIRQMGLEPGLDIDVVEVGLRPGEKLYEKLSYDEECLQPSDLDGIDETYITNGGKDEVLLDLLRHLQVRDLKGAFRDIEKLVCLDQVTLPEGVRSNV